MICPSILIYTLSHSLQVDTDSIGNFNKCDDDDFEVMNMKDNTSWYLPILRSIKGCLVCVCLQERGAGWGGGMERGGWEGGREQVRENVCYQWSGARLLHFLSNI